MENVYFFSCLPVDLDRVLADRYEYEIKKVAEWKCYTQLTLAAVNMKQLVDCNFFQVGTVTDEQRGLRTLVPHAYGYDGNFQTGSKQHHVEGQYHILHSVKALCRKLKVSAISSAYA